MAVHTFEEIRDEAERQGRIIDEQKKAETGTDGEAPEPPAETGTDGEAPEPPAEAGTDGEAPEPPAEAEKPSERRDWVKEAYECFVKDAKDIDPTDPVKAIEVYFERQATDELKARCKAEGKDAEGCWKFITAVARKALHGRSGHIDPAVVYAIAMHWFEDVPKDWDKAERSSAVRTKRPAKTAKKTSKIEKLEQKVAQGQTEPVRQKAKEELRKAKAKRAQRPATPKRKPNTQAAAATCLRQGCGGRVAKAAKQGFFFEMLETPAEGGTEK